MDFSFVIIKKIHIFSVVNFYSNVYQRVNGKLEASSTLCSLFSFMSSPLGNCVRGALCLVTVKRL